MRKQVGISSNSGGGGGSGGGASPNLSLIDRKVPRGSICRKSLRAEDTGGKATAEFTKVVISAACCDLPCDKTFAVITLQSGSYMTEKDTVTTEVIEDTVSPVYGIPLITSYKFEERQMIEIEVFSARSLEHPVAAATTYNGAAASSATVSFHQQQQQQQQLQQESSSRRCPHQTPHHHFDARCHGRKLLGACSVSLGHLIHCGGRLTCPLTNSRSGQCLEYARCIFHVEEYRGNKENIMLKLSGRGLDKKDFFGKSDPYVIIEKRNDKGRLVRTYRTEVIKNTLDPDWKPIKVSLDRLCGGDFRREIKFRCYDWDGAEGDPEDKDIEFDEFIGEFSTTPKDLFSCEASELQFDLVNPRKAKKKKHYRNSGVISLKTVAMDSDHSFLDYMFGGTDLCFTVAIDMTASNGSPSQPTSLHYTDPFTPNQYTIAMQAVLEIIQDYDTDQLLPAFGFGCRVPPEYKVSHEWPLNGNSENPFCQGASGVLDAYRRCLEEVRLSGPTNFAPVIRHVSRLAVEHQDGSRYYVLLILTDGTIDDWTECKRAVIEASFLPVSIIVVGIGNGDFTEMELLDQDVWLLEEGGQKACRDIVQFVELRKYLRPAADGTDGVRWSKVALAKDVLQELPTQIMEYMRRRRLRPASAASAAAAAAAAAANPNAPVTE
ncbi:hypothetical protein BOX15_Mlig029885g1 [Macrostomum lignano]|uniref:C2 domain-containing protein n=1 Tax=Macrostomum lignano TaxID=282301 RepID=A0A267H4K5_9PLAT|nr:hypothetical protein BOX15_Mlig029885g1 [Macrostomum lignano]